MASLPVPAIWPKNTIRQFEMSSLFPSENYFNILPNDSKNFNAAVGDNSIAWGVHETT